MSDESSGVDVPENPAVAVAMSRLVGLDAAPLEQHVTIFEDIRVGLRSALDAD